MKNRKQRKAAKLAVRQSWLRYWQAIQPGLVLFSVSRRNAEYLIAKTPGRRASYELVPHFPGDTDHWGLRRHPLAPDAEYRRSTEHVFTDGGRYTPRLLEVQNPYLEHGLPTREFFWNGRTQTLWLVETWVVEAKFKTVMGIADTVGQEVMVSTGGTIRNYYEEIVK